MSMVLFLDTNDKFTSDIKPEWPLFSQGNTEMLFNKTDSGLPVVELVTTDPALLGRCKWVYPRMIEEKN